MAAPLQEERERESGERQKPPTCEDKALDSCDNDGDKEEKEEETELILELRLEVKERAGIQPLLWIRLTFPFSLGIEWHRIRCNTGTLRFEHWDRL